MNFSDILRVAVPARAAMLGAKNQKAQQQQAQRFQDLLMQQKNEDRGIENAYKVAQTNALEHPAPKPAAWTIQEAEDGVYAVNPATQEAKLIPGLKPKAKPVAPRNIDPLSPEGIAAQKEIAASKPQPGSQPGESERRASGLLEEIMPDAEILKNYSPQVSGLEAALPSGVANVLTRNKPDAQRALQAASNLVASYLYAVSGATVQPSELQSRAKLILPQIGDSEELKAQKKATIDRMVATVQKLAGRAGTPAPTAPVGPSGNINLDAKKPVSKEEANAILAKYGIK